MQRFTALYLALDGTTRTSEKRAHLVEYFRAAPAADAAWAVFFLTGHRLRRVTPSRGLRAWAAEASGLPPWIIGACHDTVGDLAETLAILVSSAHDDANAQAEPIALHRLVLERVAALRGLSDDARQTLVLDTWRGLSEDERFVFNKLLLGGFRVGVAKRLVTRALAEVASVDAAVMAHRLMGGFEPTEAGYEALVSPDDTASVSTVRPYPFCLAHPLEHDPATLGAIDEWLVEDKWDGIRGQLMRRGATTLLWSRGDELVGEQFPEIIAAAWALPGDAVLDGEVLAWSGDAPLPFARLQRRLGRAQRPQMDLFTDVPVAFIAFDVLERDGKDVRDRPLIERRVILESLLAGTSDPVMRCSTVVPAPSWEACAALRETARERGAEGLMLKCADGAYGVGRVRGTWWKWKVDPHTIDAVLVYAQRGSGRRAGLFTDYTFAVWDEGELVPVAKAYSGLTDAEIKAVDRHVRRTTVERSGPVHQVRPELVFELAFDRVQPSPRHRAGLALRFPRMARWRDDKRPEDADDIDVLRALVDPDGDRS